MHNSLQKRHLCNLHASSTPWSPILKHRCCILTSKSVNSANAETASQPVVPDFTIDDILAGATVPPASKPAATLTAPSTKSKRRKTSNVESSDGSIGGQSSAVGRLSRMLQQAKARRSQTSDTSSQQSHDPSISTTTSLSTSEQHASETIDVRPVEAYQPLSPPSTSSQSDPLLSSLGSLPSSLNTKLKMRSRVLNLGQEVQVPTLTATSIGPKASSSQQTSPEDTAEGLVLVTSTRQSRRRRKTSQDESIQPLETVTKSLRPQKVNQSIAVNLDSWFLQDSPDTSSMPLVAEVIGRPTPSQQSVLESPAPQRQNSSFGAVVSHERGSKQQAIEQHISSTPSQWQSESITMENWQAVAEEGWPDVYSPGYHTSLFEFLLDVWLDAGKAFDRGRLDFALHSMSLLTRCWTSPEPVVRHSAVLSLAEALPSSEPLQEHLQEQQVVYQDILHQAVHPIVQWLHKDDLGRAGDLYDFHTSLSQHTHGYWQTRRPANANRHAGSHSPAGTTTKADSSADAPTEVPSPVAGKKRRGRRSKSSSNTSEDSTAGTAVASMSSGLVAGVAAVGIQGSGSQNSIHRKGEAHQGHDEWKALIEQLQRMQPAYPAVSPAALITLLDTTDMHD